MWQLLSSVTLNYMHCKWLSCSILCIGGFLIVLLSFISLLIAKRTFNVNKANEQVSVHFSKPKASVPPKVQAPPPPSIPAAPATPVDTGTQPKPTPRAPPTNVKKPPPKKPGLKAPNCPPPLPPPSQAKEVPSIAQWEKLCMCECVDFSCNGSSKMQGILAV